jgi:hypothetical protein
MHEMQKELEIHIAQKDMHISELQKTNQMLLDDIETIKNNQLQIGGFAPKEPST